MSNKLEDMARAKCAPPPKKVQKHAERSEPSEEQVPGQPPGLEAQTIDALVGLDAFLSFVGHELRNPMTPMLGNVQLLRRRVRMGSIKPEEIGDALERIERLLRRYIRRATTLLDVSSLRAAGLKPESLATDIREAVKDAVASLSPLAGQSGSTLACVLPSEAVVGGWDPVAIRQILDNLLTIAIKNGDGKSIDIALEVRGNNAVIAITDRSRGIASEDPDGVFEGFECGCSPSGAVVGWGAYLWLVRRLAVAMGGSIAVSSDPREGSVFTLILPRRLSRGDT